VNEDTIFEEQIEESAATNSIEAKIIEENDALSEPETEVTPPTLEEQLKTAQDEALDYKDRWLRSQAEFANARKRMDKQRTQINQNATVDLVAKILPIIDDFDRAMQNTPEEIIDNGWFEGIQLVGRKLAAILEGLSVLPIEAVGEPFDPNLHEAITQEPSDEYDSGVVCRELQKGYKIGDRVIRPSLVCVAA
jgi:molecular chaperone GrpE